MGQSIWLGEVCTKNAEIPNSKLMVQSYCLAEVSNKEASKPILKIHGSIDLLSRDWHE